MLPIDPLAIPDFVRLVDRGNDQIADARTYPTCWDFEAPLPAVIASLAPALEGAFYDVGANTGFYSVLVGKIAPTKVIRSFEPVSEIAQMCRENLALNRVHADVREVALSDQAGESNIYFPSDSHGLIETSASLNPNFKPMVGSRVVPTQTLDEVAEDETVGLVKVDVEGYEHVVLKGAVGTIRRDRPVMVVEVLPQGDVAALNSMKAEFDYVGFALLPPMRIEQREELVFDPGSWNYLLVPRERQEVVEESLSGGMVQLQDMAAARDWSRVETPEELLALQAAVERDVSAREREIAQAQKSSWLNRLRQRGRS